MSSFLVTRVVYDFHFAVNDEVDIRIGVTFVDDVFKGIEIDGLDAKSQLMDDGGRKICLLYTSRCV